MITIRGITMKEGKEYGAKFKNGRAELLTVEKVKDKDVVRGVKSGEVVDPGGILRLEEQLVGLNCEKRDEMFSSEAIGKYIILPALDPDKEGTLSSIFGRYSYGEEDVLMQGVEGHSHFASLYAVSSQDSLKVLRDLEQFLAFDESSSEAVLDECEKLILWLSDFHGCNATVVAAFSSHQSWVPKQREFVFNSLMRKEITEGGFESIDRAIQKEVDTCVYQIAFLCSDDPLDGDSTKHISDEFATKLNDIMGNS